MEIIRLEQTINREGNPEIFCHVLFDSEIYGKLSFGHWLTPSEYTTYILDNNSIITIMLSYKEIAEFMKHEELSTLN